MHVKYNTSLHFRIFDVFTKNKKELFMRLLVNHIIYVDNNIMLNNKIKINNNNV